MAELMPWHRLIGISWTDLLTGQPAKVETEMDLSIQQQLLDVVIVRTTPQPIAIELPDGIDDLAAHNLISFKSHQEALTDWALLESIAHSVNYRKLVSPRPADLLPVDCFRVFAVTVRFSRDLANRIPFLEVQTGVFEVTVVTQMVRIIVIERLPRAERNAMLLPFSMQPDNVRFGALFHRLRSERTSRLLRLLYSRYQEEGTNMPYTREDFDRDSARLLARTPTFVRALLAEIPIEQLLADVPVQQRLEGVSIADLLRSLTQEQRDESRARLQADQKPPTE